MSCLFLKSLRNYSYNITFWTQFFLEPQGNTIYLSNLENDQKRIRVSGQMLCKAQTKPSAFSHDLAVSPFPCFSTLHLSNDGFCFCPTYSTWQVFNKPLNAVRVGVSKKKQKRRKNASRFFWGTDKSYVKEEQKREGRGSGTEEGWCEGIWKVLEGGGRIRTDANAYSTRRPTPLSIISAQIGLGNTKNNRESCTKEMGRDWNKQRSSSNYYHCFINSRLAWQGHAIPV